MFSSSLENLDCSSQLKKSLPSDIIDSWSIPFPRSGASCSSSSKTRLSFRAKSRSAAEIMSWIRLRWQICFEAGSKAKSAQDIHFLRSKSEISSCRGASIMRFNSENSFCSGRVSRNFDNQECDRGLSLLYSSGARNINLRSRRWSWKRHARGGCAGAVIGTPKSMSEYKDQPNSFVHLRNECTTDIHLLEAKSSVSVCDEKHRAVARFPRDPLSALLGRE